MQPPFRSLYLEWHQKKFRPSNPPITFLGTDIKLKPWNNGFGVVDGRQIVRLTI